MHPYADLPDRAFWSTAVARRPMLDIGQLWDPKYPIGPRHRVATFGSCFAQHIGRALAARGYDWLVTEPAPRGLGEADARKYNYGVFSARTGNIYTVSLLKQWVDWALGEATPPDEVWERDGRFYDPFRPAIEPNGFASVDEMLRSRDMAIEAFRSCLWNADVLVFTLGLTESWFHAEHGYEYPMCPGTVAGTFDPQAHQFVNQDYAFISQTLAQTVRQIKAYKGRLRLLLTVSPVPLTATASGSHVLVATTESKAILRAVAGQAARRFGHVDYFPSYEIISTPPFRGSFFEANQRSVAQAGVDHVMKNFFACMDAKYGAAEAAPATTADDARNEDAAAAQDDVVCEEALLGAFAKN